MPIDLGDKRHDSWLVRNFQVLKAVHFGQQHLNMLKPLLRNFDHLPLIGDVPLCELQLRLLVRAGLKLLFTGVNQSADERKSENALRLFGCQDAPRRGLKVFLDHFEGLSQQEVKTCHLHEPVFIQELPSLGPVRSLQTECTDVDQFEKCGCGVSVDLNVQIEVEYL